MRLFSLELDPFVVNFGRRFGGPALTRAKTILGQAADAWSDVFALPPEPFCW